MLRFGTITAINPLTARARVQFAQDGLTSYWLPVLQNKTFKDKFYSMLSVGEQVTCLMDEKSEDGVILGAIYTAEDTPINQSEKEVAANFDDGTFINVNKETQTLTISFPNINIVGNITQDGTLANTNGITSQADVADATSTMQAIRDIYNPHTHVGNMGSPTSTPDKGM